MRRQDDVSTALHALVGAPCLVKLRHDSEVQGRIVAISVECLLDDLERSTDLTVFIVDLGFGDLRELSGAELSLIG